MSKNAVLLGASGLIGGQLLPLLLASEAYLQVTILVRSTLHINHPKLKEVIVDFENRNQLIDAIPDNPVVFCCVGTTRKKVKGDMNAYRKVDFDIPVTIGQLASEKNANTYLLVSAVGADANSGNFYLKLKGETELALRNLQFPSLYLFRPSLLLGNRSESRMGESIAQKIMGPLSFLFSGKYSLYKAIEAKDVANAMYIASLLSAPGTTECYWKEMMDLIEL
ncbi:MAG: NAD(P)H-binding protein [Chitinophagaceae bacterium]|nr:NAD(P)H-binding protein [Chitinophagaceae bacterium]